ncbi:MAG: WYL domain-containing protein [Treponema sp.]|nr:WYL domain-containing protein [Treponema sp.]
MSNDISEVNMLRDFVREIYVESFHSPNGHISIHSPSGRSEGEAKSRLHAFFEENFITKNSENEDVLKFDSRTVNQNPLFAIWKMCHFKPEYLTRDFALFDLLSTKEYEEGLSDYDLKCDDSGKNKLEFYTGKPISHKQLDLYIPNFRTNGILIAKDTFNKEGKLLKSTYKLSNTKKIQNLIKCNPEIIAAIQFASETFPCGVIGSYILDSVDSETFPSIFNFKHHFIYNTLDSEVMYTIFSAINEKRFVTIKRKGDDIICATPIQVRFSARDGRSYLVYHTNDVNHKGFNIGNCENIISMKKSEECTDFDSLITEYDSIKINLWGKSIKINENKTEHVDFTIQYTETEAYILERLKREAFSGHIESDTNDNKATFSFELFDSKELIPWIRSYFGRITQFKFENKELQQQLTDEIEKMHAMYNNLSNSQNESHKPAENHFPKSLVAKTDERIIDDETDFFNRIYSAYYRIALKTVKAINNKKITTLKELISYTKNFKVLEGKTPNKSNRYQLDFRTKIRGLYRTDDESGMLYTPFKNIPDDFMFPLTTIEISFLKALVNDDRCKLIMGDSFNLLKSELDTPKYNDIYPYFDKDKYIVFDQYLNGDQLLFEDQTYKENLKLLIDAVKEQRAVFFEYIEDGMPKTKVSVPEKIEYSQKENRFKVVLNSKNRPLDIQNILLCKYSDGKLSPSKKKEILTCVVAIDIPEEKKYIRNRLFREFSPFERDCEKIDESGHILKFKFEAGDYKEIAYRLLQFGPYVYCSEPECVHDRIKEKIDQQYQLTFSVTMNNLDIHQSH